MEKKRNSTDTSNRKRFPDGSRNLQAKQEFITYIDHSSIRVRVTEKDPNREDHWHSATEIMLQTQGESVYALPEKTYRVTDGQILIVPADYPHTLKEKEGSKRIQFLFEPTYLLHLRDMSVMSPLIKCPIYLNDESDTHRQIRELLIKIASCYEQKQPMWNSLCYSYLLQIYVLLGRRQLNQEAPLQHLSDRKAIDSEIMNSALTYLNQNYMYDITLEDVAAYAGFSKYYFSRMFKQFFGFSFSEYLCKRRLEVAGDLLTHTNRPIQEIAIAAGFGSVGTFNRIFRAAKNCTPSQYRAMYGDF
ncbi:MAG: helix-turn-helix domain-containing protein [Clostridia bacterium]|nr:helix-turn-helix domain-containing protein [Clostridia bacterium]